MMLFAPNDQLQIVTNFKAIIGNKSLIQPIRTCRREKHPKKRGFPPVLFGTLENVPKKLANCVQLGDAIMPLPCFYSS